MALNKFFRFPFGTSGDRTAVPDPVDVSGFVSYEQGYGPDYQRANTDPLSKDIERNKANQLQYDITLALREYQTNGTPDWITAAQNNGVAYPYPAYARVRGTDGITYTNTLANNTNAPPHASWVPDLANSGSYAGFVQYTATQALSDVHSGYYVKFAVTVAGNVALPNLPVGRKITIANSTSSTARITITAAGGFGSILVGGGVTSFNIQPGTQIDAVSVGANSYDLFNGAGQATLSNNGWQKLPSGLIIQMFTGNGSSNPAVPFVSRVFPIAFPNQCVSLVGACDNPAPYVFAYNVKNSLGANIGTFESTSGVPSTAAYTAIAIGY